MNVPDAPRLLWVDLEEIAPCLASATPWLTAEERDRASRYVSPDLQRRALSARIFLRVVLARVLRTAPQDIRIERGQFGKPFVTGGPQFNLSHCGPLAMIALHPHLAVGLDVEAKDRVIPDAALTHVLSAAEARDRPDSGHDWLRLWVRKEAVLKAQGRGLSMHPRHLTVGHRPCEGWLAVPETEEILCDQDLVQGYCVAVAVTTPRCPVVRPFFAPCDWGRLYSDAAGLASSAVASRA